MKIISIIISLLLASLIILPAHSETLTGKITKIIDGDTVIVDNQGQRLKVRLACIDAMESKAPMGKQSTKFLQKLIPVGTQVTLNVVDTDRYKRLIAEIYKGNNLVNLQLVQEGKVVVYQKYLNNCPNNSKKLLDAEAQAKAKKIGFWGLPVSEQIYPWDWRRGKRITQLQPNQDSTMNLPSSSNLPACVKSDCNCSDFSTQAEAQEVFQAFSNDRFKLDRDNDGVACELLPNI